MSPDRLQITRLGRIGFDQPAQTPDRHVETAIAITPRFAVDDFDDAFARQNRHRVIDEQLQEREFARTQRNAFFVAIQLARAEIEFVRAEAERGATFRRTRRVRHAAAAHDRADTRGQLAWIEGLAHVIVGAEFEAEHAVDHLVARGEQDHRQVVAAFAQRAQGADAIQLRHHDVEHHDLRPLGAQLLLQGARGRQLRHGEAAHLQIFGGNVAHDGIVVDEKNIICHAQIVRDANGPA
ncbi:hypothetical protein PT2222_170076 [Paraburkholderia tropica]